MGAKLVLLEGRTKEKTCFFVNTGFLAGYVFCQGLTGGLSGSPYYIEGIRKIRQKEDLSDRRR